MSIATDPKAETGQSVELAIGGMTCASCAARVEKKLNRMDGVQATVNYSTEKAKVLVPEGVSHADLLATVEATGYTADVIRVDGRDVEEAAAPERPGALDEAESLRRRLLIVLVLTVPVIAMSMFQALQFDYWQWASLTLAAPVVTWGALAVPPGRVDEPAPRRGDDGHADLARRHRRVRVVALRAVHRRRGRTGHDDAVHPRPVGGVGRRRDLPRGRLRGDPVHPRGPLLRGQGQAPLGRRSPRPALPGRQGRRRAARGP